MELGEWFLSAIREYDDSLSAIYDDVRDEIHLYYSKSGRKSLTYSVKRKFGELYPELQRRIIRELPLHDIWKRFGSGGSYEDFLEGEERKARESKQREIDHNRSEQFKENKHLIRNARENAKRGIFSGSGVKAERPLMINRSKSPKREKAIKT